MNGDSRIEVEQEGGADRVADELFAHGLLSHVTRDSAEARERRVGRVLDGLAGTQGRGVLFVIGRTAARPLGVAAAIAIAAIALYFSGQVQSSAQAVVQQSISALRAPGDKRYQLRITYEENAPAATSSGTVDTREGGLLLLRFSAPNGREIVVGRDEQGPWAIRPDGTLDREQPDRAWPRWASVGDESIAADSVDRLLEEMAKSYRLERRGIEELEGKGGARFLHLTGERLAGSGPGASRVELWIDRESKLIERLEMRWDTPPAPRQGRRPPRLEESPDARGAAEIPPDPAGDGDAQDQMGDNGDLERAPPVPEEDAAEADDRPEPPPFLPPGLGPRGPRPGAGGPMPGGRRFRPLPPKLLVLDRVDTAAFDADWFSPERHHGR